MLNKVNIGSGSSVCCGNLATDLTFYVNQKNQIKAYYGSMFGPSMLYFVKLF